MFGSNKQKSLQLNLFGGLPSKQKSVIATNAAVLQRPFWGRLGSKSCQDKGTSCLMWNHGVRMVGIGGSNWNNLKWQNVHLPHQHWLFPRPPPFFFVIFWLIFVTFLVLVLFLLFFLHNRCWILPLSLELPWILTHFFLSMQASASLSFGCNVGLFGVEWCPMDRCMNLWLICSNLWQNCMFLASRPPDTTETKPHPSCFWSPIEKKSGADSPLLSTKCGRKRPGLPSCTPSKHHARMNRGLQHKHPHVDPQNQLNSS